MSKPHFPISKAVACCLFAGVLGIGAGRLFAAGENPPPDGCVSNAGACDDHCATQPHTCDQMLTGDCTPC